MRFRDGGKTSAHECERLCAHTRGDAQARALPPLTCNRTLGDFSACLKQIRLAHPKFIAEA